VGGPGTPEIHPFTAAPLRQQPQVLESAPNPNFHVPAPIASQPPPQNGKNEDIPRPPIQSFFNTAPPPPPAQQQQPQQPPPPPQQQQPIRTSGQNYDPIRSNYDPVRETVVSHHSYSNSQGSPSHPHSMNRASASPSISSLVDPPNHPLTSPSIAAQSFFNQQQQQARLHRDDGHTSVPPSPTVNRLAPSVSLESSFTPKVPTGVAIPQRKPDPIAPAPSGPSTISKKAMGPGSTATSSAAASPKPPKLKEPKDLYPTPPPLPGSGLMNLGGGGPADGTEFRAPTVVITIPMKGEVNKYINFTRLAEEQYGWDALHPRLAAQRDRLARVAAAGAALERNGSSKDSGDEMSLDSEGEGSNVEMGGMSDGRTGTDGGAKKVPRKRKMKEDEYDKDDGFVDDSELLWEEQAAAANDGFFVYSGPLVPEGEKPVLESRYAQKKILAECVTNTFAEPTVHQNVAEDGVAVVEVLVLRAAEVQLLWQQEELDETVSQLQDQVLEVELPQESLVSLRRIVSVWNRRSLTGRRWVQWRQCPAAMAAWPNWQVLRNWETHLWSSTTEHRGEAQSLFLCESMNWLSCKNVGVCRSGFSRDMHFTDVETVDILFGCKIICFTCIARRACRDYHP
jgi:hypothetical protein